VIVVDIPGGFMGMGLYDREVEAMESCSPHLASGKKLSGERLRRLRKLVDQQLSEEER